MRVPKRPLSDYRPEYSFHDLQRYGFQTMLIDLIEAPEPILRFFCEAQHLHEVPIADSLSPDQIQRIKCDLPKLRLFFTMNTRVMTESSSKQICSYIHCVENNTKIPEHVWYPEEACSWWIHD